MNTDVVNTKTDIENILTRLKNFKLPNIVRERMWKNIQFLRITPFYVDYFLFKDYDGKKKCSHVVIIKSIEEEIRNKIENSNGFDRWLR